ncbi:hypothetical protein [Gloeocapsa sp. PCC 7428]|uniref:hypothetical protein n=1 Tax=Gloeocapsa sp. PCC 7428 TaxID=1173026 RepID=UPI0003133467|nr:hypothetical protein [Gloeocapsa sp. PCC 7428]
MRVESVVWVLSVLYFLYTATFNLLEIATIQKPQVRLYETGMICGTAPTLWLAALNASCIVDLAFGVAIAPS